MVDSYQLAKTVHIVAVVAWMAGLFYLPRLFVYHVEDALGSPAEETFLKMERRLLAAIMRPGAVVALAAGLWVGVAGGFSDPVPFWLWTKSGVVVGLVAFHGLLEVHGRRLAKHAESRRGRYFRFINEIPTVLLIAIVALVVYKPG